MEASFTPTPLEQLKNFTIPRREDLPPDSIRNETSPSTVWHSNNFPRNGAKEHYTIGCIRDPKENGVYSKKQSTKDNAGDETDSSPRATETNEVTQTNTKNQTSVLIIHTQGTNGVKADEFNSGQPSKPPHKVTNALNSVHPLQTMDTDDNVSMNDEPDDDDVHLDVPNARQVAQDQRHGPQPPDLADQFPGAGSGPPQGSVAPDNVPGPVTK